MTHGSDNVTLLPYDRDFSCHKPITGNVVDHEKPYTRVQSVDMDKKGYYVSELVS